MEGKVCGYIADGYTRKGYIAAVPRLYPALRFTFRPALTAERARINRQIVDSKTDDIGEAIAARETARRVVNWDLTDCDDKPVPCDAEHLLRVQPSLNGRLYRVVMGFEAPDEDESERPEKLDPELEALVKGMGTEELLEKNSATG
jgi:hypothetical protein